MFSASKFKFIIFIFAVLGLAACSDMTRVKSDLNVKRAPDWVNEGYQALKNKDGRYIHGRGVANPVNDLSLQRSVADDRARAEVARVLSSYLQEVSQDFAAAAASSGGEPVNEQSVSRQIENVTKQNLSGVQIIASWRDKKTEQLWSLAELDMQNFKDVIASANYLNEDLRAHIQANADNIFDKLTEGER